MKPIIPPSSAASPLDAGFTSAAGLPSPSACWMTGRLVIRTLPSSVFIAEGYEQAKRFNLPIILDRSHPIYHQTQIPKVGEGSALADENRSYFAQTWEINDSTTDGDTNNDNSNNDIINDSIGTVAWDIEDMRSFGPDTGKDVSSFSLHMNRDGTEPVEKAIQRLAMTLQKRLIPKKKKVKGKNNVNDNGGRQQRQPVVSYQLNQRQQRMATDSTLPAESLENERIEMDAKKTHNSLWTDLYRKSSANSLFELDLLQMKDETANGDNGNSKSDEPSSNHSSTIRLFVEVNPPTLINVPTFEKFSQKLYIGVPTVVRVEAAFTTNTRVDWYLQENETGLLECVANDSFAFTPSSDHIGKSILVLVSLEKVNNDDNTIISTTTEAFRFRNVIETCPGNALLDLRKDFISRKQQDDDAIRVVTYNILADLNACTPTAQDNFYPYIDDPSIMEKERRFPVLLNEILQYKADVICLQEVDSFVFRGLLEPAMKSCNYQAYFATKQGTREGVAMFWSLDTFEAIPDSASDDMKSHLIRDLFSKENQLDGHDWKSMDDIRALMERVPELQMVLTKKLSHVLQTVRLTRRDTKQQVLVGNTHLFYHPKADHIRLLQMFGCLHQMEIERRQLKGTGINHQACPLVLCGDLNSSPGSGAARLMFQRFVEPLGDKVVPGDEQATCRWKNLHVFRWEGSSDDTADDEEISKRPVPPTIALPDSFPKLMSGYPELPGYTHYLESFKSTLDYVLVSSDGADDALSLIPWKWAETPDEELLSKHVAMPSPVFPSDHVSLVCDLKWSKGSPDEL